MDTITTFVADLYQPSAFAEYLAGGKTAVHGYLGIVTVGVPGFDLADSASGHRDTGITATG